MAPDTLASSLSFGGTNRFDDRSSLGRYGMGLPNGSLSQARRVTVVTWNDGQAWSAHLDVDEVMSGSCLGIAPPVKAKRPEAMYRRRAASQSSASDAINREQESWDCRSEASSGTRDDLPAVPRRRSQDQREL